MDECVKQKPQYMSSSSCRAKQITNSLANFVAKDMRPIALVEGSGFIEFMSVVEPNYKIPSRKHIMECTKNYIVRSWRILQRQETFGAAHTLQIAVKAGLSENAISTLVTRGRRLVTHFVSGNNCPFYK